MREETRGWADSESNAAPNREARWVGEAPPVPSYMERKAAFPPPPPPPRFEEEEEEEEGGGRSSSVLGEAEVATRYLERKVGGWVGGWVDGRKEEGNEQRKKRRQAR